MKIDGKVNLTMTNTIKSVVDYASITTNDPNPVKRRVQNIRLNHGIRFITNHEANDYHGNILDFGAGNGELSKRLASIFPSAKIFCYEPVEGFRIQAIENVKNVNNVKVIADISELNHLKIQYILCLEVFEHLPVDQSQNILTLFSRLLDKTGMLIIGVPVEVYLPALIKGIFRITRRYGDVDARFRNILLAGIGRPPVSRPVIEIADGFPYISRHMGFDYRKFKKMIEKQFALVENYGSPMMSLPVWLNFENYYVCRQK